MRGSGFSQYRLEDLRELRQIELGSDPLTICRKDYHFGVVRGNLVPVVVQNNVEAKVRDRKSTRLNSSHGYISYAVFCLKKKNTRTRATAPLSSYSLPLAIIYTLSTSCSSTMMYILFT